MNKLLLVLIVVLACTVSVLGYAKFVHDPVESQLADNKPGSNGSPFGSKEQMEAPPAPVLEARVISDDSFHAKGQWRGNPAVGDLNGDGHLDLVTSIRRWDRQTMGDGVFVYLGDGTGKFKEHNEGLDRMLGYGGAALGDVNKDGKVDLAFSGHDMTPRVYINFLDEKVNPTWVCSTPDGIQTGVICADVALGDLNRDGHPDLITVGQFPHEGSVYLWLGDGDGGFAAEKIEIRNKDNFGSRAEIVDMDGDGFNELVVALDIGARVMHWDPATKTMVDEFADHKDQEILGSDLALETIDLDGDGMRELIVSGYLYKGHKPLRIYRKDGDTWKDWGEGLPAGESFFDVKVARLSKDAPPALFVGGQWGIQLVTMPEVGRFKAVGRIDETRSIFNLAAGDMNEDGKDEVVWIGEGGVRVYEVQVGAQ